MRQILIYTLILVLFMGVVTIALSHQAEHSITPDTPSSHTNEKKNGTPDFILNYTITFSKNDFSFHTLKGFDTIQLDDGIYTMEIGKPMTPVKTIRVAIPTEINVSAVKILSLNEQPMEGRYILFPAQLPQRRNLTTTTNLFQYPNSTIYNSNTTYPNEYIRFTRQMDLAGQNIAELAIYPIHYIGAQQRLSRVTSLTFTLEGTHEHQYSDYLSIKTSDASREIYEQMVKEMVINPDEVQLQVSPLPQPLGVPPGEYDYVIITPESWVNSFQPLADWKTRKGIPATIVTTSWIYTSGGYIGTQAQKIRAFIMDANTQWGTTYFLIGADTNNIPAYTKSFTLNEKNYDVPSDTYYADYDDDWLCELHVGRASVRNLTHVTTFVNKVLTYEKTPPLTDYATTAFFCGFDLNESGSGEGKGCKEYIQNTWIPSGWTYRWEYDNETTNHKTEVLNSLNLGNNLVNHIDHANTDFIGTGFINHDQGINTTDALYRTNGNKQSIIYSIGCWACDFLDEECIAEGFLHNINGGAVAFIGNTRYGWHLPYYTDYYSLRFDRYFFRSLFTQEHYTLGVAFSDHKNDAYSDAGNGTLTEYNRYVFYELTLLGDPELPVWTENPMSLNVTHPNQLHRNSESFTIMVTSSTNTPIDQALVCLWKDTEVYLTGYTNTTGEITFYPSPVTVGVMNVTVTKHNYLPYEASTTVTNIPPVSNFTYFPLNPTTIDTIQFTDTAADSDGTIVSWSWIFGDGTASTNRNPSHHYADDGIYLVSLTVTDNDGVENTTTQSITVSNIPPTANFSYSPLHPTTSDTLQFNDSSTDIDGMIVSWLWSFGDGTTSIIRNSSHHYADDGIYLVSLTVTDNDGVENTTTQSITVSNIPPTANFTYSPLHPTTSDTLQFNDSSTDIDGMIVSWLWSFGDGTNSPLQNTHHTYSKQGTYTVTLTITDDDDAHATKSKSIFVNNTPPTPNFQYTPLNPTTSDTIQFTDTSTDPDGTIVIWLWTFGDGNTSTQHNPTHTYQKKGVYIITLNVTDDNGSKTTTSKSLSVANSPPKAYFTYTPPNPKTIDTVQFTDTSIDIDGIITFWSWTFGDGHTATEPNPTHTYTSKGIYTVSLTITDNDGAENTTNTLIQVTNTPPTSNFSYTPTYPTINDLVSFTDTSIDPDGTLQSWYWDFGDGTYSYTRNTTHQFTQNITFTVTLVVSDNDGSTTSFTKDIITRKIYTHTTYAGNQTTIDFLNETKTIVIITTTTPTNITISQYSNNPTGKNILNNISHLEHYIDITAENENVIQWPVFIKIFYTQEDLDTSQLTENQLIGIYFWNNNIREWHLYNNTGANTSDHQDGYNGYCWAQVWHLTGLLQAGDAEPPLKVEGLTVTDAHDGRLNLAWITGKDNVQIHHYKIYRNSVFLINRTSTSYQDTGLTNGQSYTYTVSAVDTSGNEGIPSNPKLGTPTESIYGGGSSPSGGGEPPAGPQNKKPVANTSAGEPYQGYVHSEITFDGSNSHDPDGTIIEWFWEFGDTTNATGKKVQHRYSKPGTYNVTLTVTDEIGETNSTTTICVITQPKNHPPIKPVITGPTTGRTNITYTYTILSTDPDNDTIRYSVTWGEQPSSNTSSAFLPSGTPFTCSHRWTTPGHYIILVTVTDNQTGTYSNITMNIESEQKNTSSTPGFEFIFLLCTLAIAILLFRKKRYNR